MAAPKKKSTGIRVEDVEYYFDSVERDRMDAAGTSRRTGEVLALRDKLLRMPEADFDAAIKTMRNLVADASSREEGDEEEGGKRRGARTLYDQVRKGGGSGAARKVAAP